MVTYNNEDCRPSYGVYLYLMQIEVPEPFFGLMGKQWNHS